MSAHLGFLECYAKDRAAELLREAANDRLADLAKGPGRPWRSRLADWLFALAARIDGESQRVVHAEA
jgi:hypothetical protein